MTVLRSLESRLSQPNLQVSPFPEDVRLYIKDMQPPDTEYVRVMTAQGKEIRQKKILPAFEGTFMSSQQRSEAAIPGMEYPGLDIKRLYVYTHARLLGKRSPLRWTDELGLTFSSDTDVYHEEFRRQSVLVVPECLVDQVIERIPTPEEGAGLRTVAEEEAFRTALVSPAALLFNAIRRNPGWQVGYVRPEAAAVYSETEGRLTLVDADGGFSVGTARDGTVTEEQLQAMATIPAPARYAAASALQSSVVA